MSTIDHVTALSLIRAHVYDLGVAVQNLQLSLDAFSSLISVSAPSKSPNAVPEVAEVAVSTETAEIRPRGFRLGSHFHRCSTKKDIYIGIWRALWAAHPSRRDPMMHASRLAARNRRYVATSRSQLFSGRQVAWCNTHSSPIGDGWYVDTNLSGRQMRVLLSRIISAAGLPPGARPEITWCESGSRGASSPSRRVR